MECDWWSSVLGGGLSGGWLLLAFLARHINVLKDLMAWEFTHSALIHHLPSSLQNKDRDPTEQRSERVWACECQSFSFISCRASLRAEERLKQGLQPWDQHIAHCPTQKQSQERDGSHQNVRRKEKIQFSWCFFSLKGRFFQIIA